MDIQNSKRNSIKGKTLIFFLVRDRPPEFLKMKIFQRPSVSHTFKSADYDGK